MRLINIFPVTRINDDFISNPDKFKDLFGFKENFTDSIVEGLPNIDFRFQADFYKKIAVDIVAETAFNYPYPFITEKTYRSIASLRPFIILGPGGILDFIRKIGFKTFPSIIDESYDEVTDSEERFFSVCNSIKKFVSKPMDNIHHDLYQIKDDLIYNQLHLKNLFNLELDKFKKGFINV